jgi:phosphate/sulfate permease
MGYYDWIFAIGVTFALLDAMGCGANDVANSMATAVNSKTLTMTEAMAVATVFEIVGAMTLGSYK